ncbi:MAG: NusG domain II-containing protein [Lachnospiraceae bacterium]|nr:NusG domain II-containing protein [Lachnospiraceae bacterium]
MKNKNNWILIGAITLALVAAVVVVLIIFKDDKGTKAVLSLNGTVIFEQDLDTDCEFPINTSKGYNIFVVKDGMAYVKEADCPHQDCVNHAPVSKKGETIVCLPHELVIEIQ